MNILHISDIHFGRENPAYGFNEPFAKRDAYMDDLIEAIAAQNDYLEIEHIVVTGDIAWHGKTEEFEKAGVFFKKLIGRLGLTGKDISFCVGNHDVDLSYQCVPSEINRNTIQEIDELYEYEHIHDFDAAIHAYNVFCESLEVEPYRYPVKGKFYNSYAVGFKDVTFKNGKTVRIVGLNTSMLLPGIHIEEDQLWLGQPQIRTLIEHGILPGGRSISNTIALYHHPEHYLHANEVSGYDGRQATIRMLMSCTDLVLCGHTESAVQPRMVKLFGGSMLLSAGACYYNDEYANTYTMLFMNGKRRQFAYLSYVHDENGWHDWDYNPPVEKKERLRLPKHQDLHYLTLKFEIGEKSYDMKLASVDYRRDEEGNISFENHKDFMNSFIIDFKENKLRIQVPEKLQKCPESVRKYEAFMTFYKDYDPENSSWSLLGPEGELLIKGKEFPAPESFDYDRELMQKMYVISEYFKTAFHVPVTESEEDLLLADRLYDIAFYGYRQNELCESQHVLHCDLHQMENIRDAALLNNAFYVKRSAGDAVQLFGVRIWLQKEFFYEGPYTVDIENINQKISSFMEGDQRCIVFTGDQAKSYIIEDVEAFERDKGPICSDQYIVFS